MVAVVVENGPVVSFAADQGWSELIEAGELTRRVGVAVADAGIRCDGLPDDVRTHEPQITCLRILDDVRFLVGNDNVVVGHSGHGIPAKFGENSLHLAVVGWSSHRRGILVLDDELEFSGLEQTV